MSGAFERTWSESATPALGEERAPPSGERRSRWGMKLLAGVFVANAT
jgi:hypothetical protein